MASKARRRTPPVSSRGALTTVPGRLGATSILPESDEVRLLDGAVTAGVAVASALWTATRPTTGQQYGWGAFLAVLGLGTAVMGRGELRYGGFGLLGVQSGYLALRTVTPVLDNGAAAALVEPAAPVRRGYGLIGG